jgi:hypothetical protein
MTAGRRRRGRKATRRGRKGVKKGGAFYGFAGAMGTNGAEWTGVKNTEFVDPATGAARPEPTPVVGGRRRKSSKKTRKSRRKMRGGANQVSATAPYSSFTGDGSRGMISPVAGYQPGNPI